MWALRRPSNPLKTFCSGRFPTSGCTRFEMPNSCLQQDYVEQNVYVVPFNSVVSLKTYHHHHHLIHLLKPFLGGREIPLSSAGIKSGGEEDDDDGELGTPDSAADATQTRNVDLDDDHDDQGLISESEQEEEDGGDIASHQKELELSATDVYLGQEIAGLTKASSRLFKTIMEFPSVSVQYVLDELGNDLDRDDIETLLFEFQKRHMYWKAWELLDWLESSKTIDLSERYYVSRVHLIAKLKGLQKAEQFMETVPESFRGKALYQTFLAACVVSLHVLKAEEVFEKMNNLQLTLTAFTYNKMLLLYKKTNRTKIGDVLCLMEKANVQPTRFTYSILIDSKGQSQDISGMEQIFETMKEHGLEPGIHTQTLLAKNYIFCGLNEKAEAVIKDIEGDNINDNRAAWRSLLYLYALLNKADEVSRIWKVCQTDLGLRHCLAAIRAWGKLKKVDEAEAVFEEMSKRWEKVPPTAYITMLYVYANNKMLAKRDNLVKLMEDGDIRIDSRTWDALVKMYLGAGEVERAVYMLKAMGENRIKPLFSSYMAIMGYYSNRGDVHNTEKMFDRARQVGYAPSVSQFQLLLKAYIKANSPAYGMRDRMIAANVSPDRVAGMLSRVYPF